MHAIEKRFENVMRSKTFRNIVRAFELEKKAVLDIGCSYGEFLARFGPGSLGLTIVPEEAAYGKEKGLDILCGNIESPDFSLDRTFDAVFANNLFEHLYSPHGFLVTTRKHLKPDGILILGVPSIPALPFLMRFKKFRGSLAEAHINFFTRRTLIKTVERAGFTVLAARGFRFAFPPVDHLLDLIYPHWYVIARPIPSFDYTEKRKKELAGYRH